MPRKTRSQTVFFRHETDERRDVYLRINPSAVRFQQGAKVTVTDTLGGYFIDRLYAEDPQYSGLSLPELTIEATTGIAYKQELKTIDWIFRHQSDRKSDRSPADLYFFNFSTVGEYMGIQRDVQQAWLITILNFAWDDSIQSFSEIKFNLRCKVLRDLFWGLDDEPTGLNSLPTLDELATIDKTGSEFKSPDIAADQVIPPFVPDQSGISKSVRSGNSRVWKNQPEVPMLSIVFGFAVLLLYGFSVFCILDRLHDYK